MALSLQALQPQNFKPIELPDPAKRFKTLADARATMQGEELRGLQIEGERGELAAQKDALAKAAKLHDILATGVLDENAVNAIMAIYPEQGMKLRTALQGEAYAAAKATEGQEAPEIMASGPAVQQAPIGDSLTDPASMSAPEPVQGQDRAIPGPLPSVQVPFGGPKLRPQSGQQMRAFEQAKERFTTDENIRQEAPGLAEQQRQRMATEEQNRLNAQAQEQERLRQERNRITDNERADRALAQTKEIADANRTAADARVRRTADAKVAEIEAAKARGELTPAQSSTALRLTNSLKSHPAYLDMLDVGNGIEGVINGLNQANGFGDISAINAFQIMIDPGATVREGDVALLRQGSGLLDKILSDYPLERLREGDQLPAATRERMKKTAQELYEKRAKNYNESIGEQYRMQAKASGIPFEFIGRDFPVAGAPSGGALPQGGGKVIDRATVEKFLDAAGNDPAKAQKLAEQNGWKLP